MRHSFTSLIIFTALMAASCTSNRTESTGLVFDCDPGTDDAAAVRLLAAYGTCPDWCVSTFGNMPWNYTQKNLNILVRLNGLGSQVALGAKTPYDGHTVTCGDFHGADGLADQAENLFTSLGMTQADIDSNKSLAALAEYICSVDDITYVATGPLSTLSHLITDYPETVSHIKRLYVMGGGIKRFNKDGDKEYNFAGDGTAVYNVFESPMDITLFPLDITEVYAVVPKEKIETMDCTLQPVMLSFLQQNCASNIKFGGIRGAVLHDCLPVMYMQQPSQFTMEDMQIAADRTGHIETSDAGRPVHVAVSCPQDLLYERLSAAVKK